MAEVRLITVTVDELRQVVREDPTLSYEHVPGTEAQVADLLDVLSVFVPEDQEDGGADPEA